MSKKLYKYGLFQMENNLSNSILARSGHQTGVVLDHGIASSHFGEREVFQHLSRVEPDIAI